MNKMIYSILLASLLLFTAGCAVRSEPETPPPPPEAAPPEAPAPETLPVVEITPVIVPEPEPEPELHTPLWDGSTPVQYVRDLHRTNDTVTVFETPSDSDLLLRLYQLESGTRVTMGRQRSAAGTLSSYTWEVPSAGVLRWYDRAAGQWQEQPFTPGEYAHSMIELAFEDGSSFLIYPPKSYRLQENEVLEYLPDHDGKLSLAKIGGRWRFTLLCSLPDADCVSDFILVQGPQPMLNWAHHYCGELWKNYTMETEGKWCFDGYYWPCPDNYVPTGENYLYRCPAAYLTKSFAYTAAVHPAADALAMAMLDTLAMEQTDAGFWPTSPSSEWLSADYGVESGFYDTRFNTDLIEIYRVYYETFGGDVLREAMEAYTAFFVDLAARTHFTTENGGWFIPDYAPAAQTPHCSLNHQIAECIELYQLADVLQQPELEALADRMLLAVSDTGSQWITETGDLHYCVFPDGTFGMQDYPYLTYNDLLELQNLLIERRGEPDPTLQLLMDQKRQWMDANGITQYNQ